MVIWLGNVIEKLTRKDSGREETVHAGRGSRNGDKILKGYYRPFSCLLHRDTLFRNNEGLEISEEGRGKGGGERKQW